VLLAVFTGFMLFAIRERGNLAALWTALRFSQDEISLRAARNEEEFIRKLSENLTPLPREDIEKLKNGELTEEEAVSIMTGANAASGEGAASKTGASGPRYGGQHPAAGAALSDEAFCKERIAALIAKLYLMEGGYTAQLESIRQSGENAFFALAESKRTTKAKISIAMDCISKAEALEEKCDAEMDSLLAELREILKEYGGDLSLIGDIRSYYAAQKDLKKAEYLSLYRQYFSKEGVN